MRSRRANLANHCLQLPGGTEDNDLWARVDQDDKDRIVVVSTWEPSAEERGAIARGANVELVVWGTSHPPVAVAVSEEALGRPAPTAKLRDCLAAIGCEINEENGGAYKPRHCGRMLHFADLVATSEGPDVVWCDGCGARIRRVGTSDDYVVIAQEARR